ncbi:MULTISPECIES: AAA family ATPase [unclassified Sphingomonas]|uniref:AAA family ATPase n=1 Tax=unclassified Sphingomonas TaxID=196159 RepID=UPI000829D825|nr:MULTISPECIES: AAA family ATPase [unclassified Sphingomonas]
MNNPENLPIDIDAERAWLKAHKDETGLSWSELSPKLGIKPGTLSQFPAGTYAGDNRKIAEQVYRYRQHLMNQAEIAVTMPDRPDYFETPTSRRILSMLSIAQRGRIVVIAGGPGTSKTMTVKHYKATMPNVWHATMKPSTAGVNTMQIKVLEAMGEHNARGTPLALSSKIESIVRNTDGLIIIDEAQHTSEKALEEIRGWHDETGIGIALVGNEDVLTRLTLGNKRDAFARLASRVAQRLIFRGPSAQDALALADAWHLDDEPMRQFLVGKAGQPGGLRTLTMIMETAAMFASGEKEALALAHLQDAWTHLSFRGGASL